MQKSLNFVMSGAMEKYQCYQWFDVDAVPPSYNFIKNYTPAKMFTFEFCGFYEAAALLKKKIWQRCLLHGTFFKSRLQHRCFLMNFEKFFSLQLYEKRESDTVFCINIAELLRNTYSVEHLRKTASKVWSGLDSFTIFICSLKWKIKRYQR